MVVTPPVSVASTRTVSYWLDVQPVRDGRPAPVYASIGTEPIDLGAKIRLHMESSTPGFVYLLNDDQGELALVYPSAETAEAARGREPLAAHETGWFGFAGAAPEETLWLVWAAERVAALEPLVPLNNSRQIGIVRDAETAAVVRRWLVEAADGQPGTQATAAPRVNVPVSGGEWARRLVLRHTPGSNQ